jgi:hypothetical protein
MVADEATPTKNHHHRHHHQGVIMKNHRTIRTIPAATLAVAVLLAGCGDDTETTLPAVEAAGAGAVTSDRHFNENARFQDLKPSNVVIPDRFANETARFESLEPSKVTEYGTSQRLVAEAIDAQLSSRQSTAPGAGTVDSVGTAQKLIAESIEAELEARRAKIPSTVRPVPVGLFFRAV